MPTLEDGDLDHNGPLVKAPPTPPQEPTIHEHTLNGVSILVDRAVLGQTLPRPQQQEIESDIQKLTEAYCGDGTGKEHILNYSHEDQVSTNDGTAEQRPRHPSLNGSNARVRRSSSDYVVPSANRRLSKKHSGEPIIQYARSPEYTSFTILSPTMSEQSTNTEAELHGLPQPLLPSKEGRILHSASPSLNDAAQRVSHARTLDVKRTRKLTIDVGSEGPSESVTSTSRPRAPRALSTPVSVKSPNSVSQEYHKARNTSRSEQSKPRTASGPRHQLPSPMPASVPMPPMSLHTYLQLELSSQRPSQMYIHRSATSDFPYESSRVKTERLLNFIFLPHQLEGVLWFGVLACLDSWLYTFTILPLRMVKSIYILCQSWTRNLAREAKFISSFVYAGSQRMWHRRCGRGQSSAGVLSRTSSETQISQESSSKARNRLSKHHRRTKSVPSTLLPDDKADILKGLLIIFTCLILLRLDASRMYHWVRGQAAIKLYVIYNLLEVCDRLLSAIGQDVLECLFSQEALERKPDGHSKILRPFWLFLLAFGYSVVHATALFYQVVTLNVAVNSYSNALITLLMSNQFVEIKGTVFKKFERESLFQITCADIVERFQLWHMLMIIASRNVVETGGFNIGMSALLSPAATTTSSGIPNITQAAPPLTAASILPRSFMIVPSMLSSVGSYVPTISHVLGPFVIVLGSEMLIDWLKHAYINKFNNTKPVIYGRFLDILAKDYYTNAFGDQNLMKRLGLPVIPLSCLMIRAGFQTYQMFVASWVPAPSSSNMATLASIHHQYSTTRAAPTTTAGMIVRKMDELFNQLPTIISNSTVASHCTTILVLVLMFLVLLVCKLTLGMCLLAFSRARYASMKEREHTGNPSYYNEGSRRVGGWGVVEVDDDKRPVIYEDDPAGMQAFRAKEAKDKAKKEQERKRGYSADGLEKIKRYEMAAKRIW